ncbi:MAG: alpha/beta fold hydrolase [Cryobacterium sp.]|nr:alpha/beta fold hydrolase [Cryobacterium sp.]
MKQASRLAGIRSSGTALRTRAILAVGFGAILALSVSLVSMATRIARMVIVPPKVRDQDAVVLGVNIERSTITFRKSYSTQLPGKYGFWFDGDSGHGQVGEILWESPDSITRELLGVDFGDISSAEIGRLSGWLHLHPSQLGFHAIDVEIDTEFGSAPAWVIPGSNIKDETGPDWVIQIHGRASTRAEGLRATSLFQSRSISSLLISYRNDLEAPPSYDGLYALGQSEWADVDAALSYAAERGAKRVILMGWSMGGAIAFQTLFQSRHRELIAGLILDSPVVDWFTTLDFQGKAKGFVGPLRWLTYQLLSRPWGVWFTRQSKPINLNQLNILNAADQLNRPILILASSHDDFVPASGSIELAAMRPDLVELELFEGAGHTRLWNLDPERWDTTIETWLEKHFSG